MTNLTLNLKQTRSEKQQLEVENKKLKFRNFVVESDLKTLLRKIQYKNLSLQQKTAFKLQEFRTVYEFMVGLTSAEENLTSAVVTQPQFSNTASGLSPNSKSPSNLLYRQQQMEQAFQYIQIPQQPQPVQ